MQSLSPQQGKATQGDYVHVLSVAAVSMDQCRHLFLVADFISKIFGVSIPSLPSHKNLR